MKWNRDIRFRKRLFLRNGTWNWECTYIYLSISREPGCQRRRFDSPIGLEVWTRRLLPKIIPFMIKLGIEFKPSSATES